MQFFKIGIPLHTFIWIFSKVSAVAISKQSKDFKICLNEKITPAETIYNISTNRLAHGPRSYCKKIKFKTHDYRLQFQEKTLPLVVL